MQFGLYLRRPEGIDVWRVVSEDSGLVDQPFLLIGCTARIVTSPLVPARYPRILSYSSIWPNFTKAAIHLRTVIVTAAVYRGFDQELRLAADPIN